MWKEAILDFATAAAVVPFVDSRILFHTSATHNIISAAPSVNSEENTTTEQSSTIQFF